MGAGSRRFRCSALRGEDGRHLVNALLKSSLRLIPGIFGRVAVLNHGHLRTPIAEVIEADHVLAVIGNSRSHSKISRDQPIALGSAKLNTYAIRECGCTSVYVHLLYMSPPPNSAGARIATSVRPPTRKSTFGEWTAETVRSPPLFDQIRFAPGAPRLLRRNWKRTSHHDVESLTHGFLLFRGADSATT
jgi:hypothetical protein